MPTLNGYKSHTANTPWPWTLIISHSSLERRLWMIPCSSLEISMTTIGRPTRGFKCIDAKKTNRVKLQALPIKSRITDQVKMRMMMVQIVLRPVLPPTDVTTDITPSASPPNSHETQMTGIPSLLIVSGPSVRATSWWPIKCLIRIFRLPMTTHKPSAYQRVNTICIWTLTISHST